VKHQQQQQQQQQRSINLDKPPNKENNDKYNSKGNHKNFSNMKRIRKHRMTKKKEKTRLRN
jgi:hypothetical protein